MGLPRGLFLFLLAALVALGQPPRRNVLAGVYTDAQAKRGAEAYQANCAKCHEGADVDGPPLTGDPFIDRWRDDSLATLFDFIKTEMPQDKPGKLDNSGYRDILAYLLQANDYPSGPQELSADAVRDTDLVGKQGPQLLPTNALVRTVGCLEPNGSGWMLANAAQPNRTRVTDHSTPDELRSSAAKPLGKQSFRLQNLDDLSNFHGDALRGHKVQVKGVLVRDEDKVRINVASLDSVATTCGQ